FSSLLQGQRDLETVGRLILSELAPLVCVQHGALYLYEFVDGEPAMKLLSSYAYQGRDDLPRYFKLGEGLVGQSALESKRIILTSVPADYVRIRSGLGESTPLNIVVLPALIEGETRAVLELASFEQFSDTHLSFLDQLTESIGIVFNTLAVNLRTEVLRKQSQALTQELQQTNLELEEKAHLLSEQNEEVERRRREIEEARRARRGRARP
ncbi:MAG: GAF domain-containing protein, partial [Chloroflexota bacterium]